MSIKKDKNKNKSSEISCRAADKVHSLLIESINQLADH
jgi:hypothetical protein